MVNKEAILRTFRNLFDPFEMYQDDETRLTVHDDGTLDVDGVVYLHHDVDELPIKFGVVAQFFAVERGLKTLKNMPRTVKGPCHLDGNKLTTLVGAPETVGEDLELYRNPLENLNGFPREVGGKVKLIWAKNLPLLRTLVAKEIILHGQPRVDAILNKYAGQGRGGAIDCKRELVAAGFEGNARW